jgi:hypothetical protein
MILLSVRVFEALNCYFPITFTPPPHDPFGITTEMLVAALEDCLCSSCPTVRDGADQQAMIRLTVPFFIEQLDSDLPVARAHALRALTRLVRTHLVSYRVFGLLSGSGVGGNGSILGVSAQDRALMDMVVEEDGYTDLYVQDAPASAGSCHTAEEAGWTTEPVQAHLVRTLGTLSEKVYSLLTEASGHGGGGGGGGGEQEDAGGQVRVQMLLFVSAMTTALSSTDAGALHIHEACMLWLV